MKKYFVPYEIALLLKEIAYNESCIAGYTDWGKTFEINSKIVFINERTDDRCKECSAPLYDQVIDWFIEKYNIHIQPVPKYGSNVSVLYYHISFKSYKNFIGLETIEKSKENHFTDKKECLNWGFLKVIELVKKKS